MTLVVPRRLHPDFLAYAAFIYTRSLCQGLRDGFVTSFCRPMGLRPTALQEIF